MSVIKKTGDQRAIDLLALARVLLKKVHYIILCMVVFGAAFYGWTHYSAIPTYRASVTLYVNNTVRDGNNSVSSADLYASARLVETYSVILTSDTVLDKVIEEANLKDVLSTQMLRASMMVASINDTEVFSVTVQLPDARTAMRAANAIATIAPEQLTDIISGGTAKVVDYAKLPTAPVGVNYRRSALLGMILGFLLSAGFLTLRAVFDNSVKGAEDFAQWDYPLLASIPDLEEAEAARNTGYGYVRRRVSGHKKSE